MRAKRSRELPAGEGSADPKKILFAAKNALIVARSIEPGAKKARIEFLAGVLIDAFNTGPQGRTTLRNLARAIENFSRDREKLHAAIEYINALEAQHGERMMWTFGRS